MGSRKQKNQKQQLSKTPTKKHKNQKPLGPRKSDTGNSNSNSKSTKFKRIRKGEKKKKNQSKEYKEERKENEKKGVKRENDAVQVQQPTPSQQLSYFLHQYQSANGIQLSTLELESFKADTCMVELSQVAAQNNLGEHMKTAFGSSFKEVLCEKQLGEGNVDPGNPALLVISLSALRSLELLRELRPLTNECHAVKLFSKHMKIEEQVSFLKNRVNVACGTPNRIKKLIDMEALGLSRLAVIVLDMHTDVKGYSLFTLPQVREEFWDLYKSYIHPRLLEGDLRICLYGQIPAIRRAPTEAKDN
ncbi:protein CMSS1-like [Coffea eugenioides]|uniref:protein CMSS1-like n=1 Tax=Coffea eugenioides TaxID=49369 RepID=UPI000F613880|nr:protein CMSS1-like [Coffea eugenioides]